MLDRTRHELILKNILRDIYTATPFQSSLGFKEGTCLYLFYGLDRFSVDLDFNLLQPSFNHQLMTDLLAKYLTIQEQQEKQFTWFWLGSYATGKQRIKIEINKRPYPDRYVPKNFYGLTLPTLAPECMFAHKLCAITDRKRLQSRDLYDTHFMFTKQFPIDREIIKLRTGKTLAEYLKDLVRFVEQKTKHHQILDGLGELLDSAQKQRTKATLVRDVLIDLRLLAEAEADNKSR